MLQNKQTYMVAIFRVFDYLLRVYKLIFITILTSYLIYIDYDPLLLFMDLLRLYKRSSQSFKNT